MKFFQDMSEVPLYPMEDLSLSQNASDSNPSSAHELESSTEFSFLSKPSDANPLEYFPGKDSNKELYTALQSPLPLLYSWSPTEICPSDVKDVLTEGKTRKSARSKGIRKVDVDRKKTIKQMRNRISAQRSRDRKKKELDDLREETTKLREENSSLKFQLEAANKELQALRGIIAQGKVHSAAQAKSEENPTASGVITKKALSKAAKKNAKKCHLLLATFVFGCLCIAACVNPLMKPLEKVAVNPFEGLPGLAKPIEIPESLLMRKPRELTPLQKARREFIERNSSVSKLDSGEAMVLENMHDGKNGAISVNIAQQNQEVVEVKKTLFV